MNPEVSIVIVSFNTRDITKQCLASIFEFTKGVVFEIIVVDNGSVDGSPEIIEAEFPSVRMIRNDRNTGFAAAQNRGMLAASGAYILVLNSDIVFTADSITAMADELKKDIDVGMIGPKILNIDGSLAPSARRSQLSLPLIALSVTNRYFRYSRWLPQQFLRIKLAGRLAKLHDNFSPHDTVKTVDYVDGMCCLLKRSVLEQVGLFDEQFFFDYEIIDLANRVRGKGWRIVYHPWITVIHMSHSTRRKVRWILLETTRSEFIYYAKYYPAKVRPLRIITNAVVKSKLALNRVIRCFSSDEERTAEDALLGQVLTISQLFQVNAGGSKERIPKLETRRHLVSATRQ